MGFRARKSINLGGGFRINLSKSGIGYSWGVPGYRITKTSKGRIRKTSSIPGTGLSYVDETGSNLKNRNPSDTRQENNNNPIMEDLNSAEIQNFQSVEYSELTSSISRVIKMNKISTWLCLTFILCIYNPLFIIICIAGIVLKLYVHLKGRVVLNYEMDDDYLEQYKNRISAWNELNNCNRFWQIIRSGSVYNKKVHAGASRLINRVSFKIKVVNPFYIKTNINVIQLPLKKEQLVLLPDKILIIQKTKVGAINYSDVQISVDSVRFIETESVPKDATIIDYTWAFVNKNGSPDKRYKNNRRLPICDYGQITLTSTSGLNVEFQCSSIYNANIFAQSII